MTQVMEVLIVWDGVSPEPLNGERDSRTHLASSLPPSLPVRHAALSPWTGGEDPLRYGRLARMREVSRRLFLSSGCDYLYWHDCDMIPPTDIVERLLELDAPLATGCYPYRGLSHAMQPILHCRKEDVTEVLQRCDGYGMGCMLVRRDVIEQTPFRSPAYWRDVDPNGVGEDWQWGLDCGQTTLVDTRLGCWHCCGPGDKCPESRGMASRIVFGGAVFGVVWMGGGEVTNEWGTWRHGGLRADLTPEQAETLPPGFARGMAQEMTLEWEETRVLLGKERD